MKESRQEPLLPYRDTLRQAKVFLVLLVLLVLRFEGFVESFITGNRPKSIAPRACRGVRSFPLLHVAVTEESTSLSESTKKLDDEPLPSRLLTKQTTCSIEKNLTSRRSFLRRKQTEKQTLRFTLDYDEVSLGETPSTTGILLIHPIGVGIGKWFYSRLIKAMSALYSSKKKPDNLLIVAPDLLGSGTACSPTSDGVELDKLPLLNLTDWTDEILNVISDVQEQHPSIGRWCLVANGGCSPIALQVAARTLDGTMKSSSQINVTNIVLSSVPRLPFFTRPNNEPAKVAKSYKTLCGVAGKLFWWYSCRKDGKFIKTFSEKNLVADPDNLGDLWPKNCIETAKARNGKSKFSTFAFLAGALQDGCEASLNTLKDSHVQVDILKGRDVRQNLARSWFWSKRKRKAKNVAMSKPRKTIRDLLEENGNGGREVLIGGRVSLAHEDPYGYANAIYEFL